ncbi:MAG: 1-acyl-sn-glycerol-3-phosphate acyltransferase [Scytonematopsis contorta HA4267-MV1]|jgi:hypothetical protein|nr:1-acyl-sn-glycerol-3-phosphate acyltransferase [Scytonematopsis contorta HA4267-MV1]
MYHAQPPLEFIPPSFNPWLLKTTHVLLPAWISWQTAITNIEAENVEVLVNLYREFQEGKNRFLIAFRHPRADDPLCLGYLFSKIIPKAAKKQGVKLELPVHAHFIYDRGITLWAGSHIGWLASNLGGTPIQRGKADWTGLRSARDLFVNGKFPMGAAPEGATNGLNEVISPLEPGIAQMGFWCAEDLQKAERNEQVFIVPVGIKYNYIDDPWSAIANLLSDLEVSCGLPVGERIYDLRSSTASSLYSRLIALAERLLSSMEEFYTKFYRKKLPLTSHFTENEAIAQRLKVLMNTALEVAEEYFGLQSKGNFNDRCRRVEQAGWNYIFREDFKDVKGLSPLERGLGDRIAEEANMRMWHMRLVESFVAVTGSYVREKPSPERFAETALIVWEMVTKIQGGGESSKRPTLGKQRAVITVGEPLSVSERFPVYKGSRLTARQAVADLTKDLQVSLERLI